MLPSLSNAIINLFFASIDEDDLPSFYFFPADVTCFYQPVQPGSKFRTLFVHWVICSLPVWLTDKDDFYAVLNENPEFSAELAYELAKGHPLGQSPFALGRETYYDDTC